MPSTKVLLADDHTVVRAGLRNALNALPDLNIIAEVGNGKDLMEAVEKHTPNLVVMDVSMPDFEPVSSVRRLKSQYPDLKILIVSAYDDESYVIGLLNAGVNGYHMKDQPLSDLQMAVQRVLNGDSWISGRLVGQLANNRQTERVPATPMLTKRQRELLQLLIQGMDNRQIALKLDLSVKTIENHLTALYRALGVDSRLKAVHVALNKPELLALRTQEIVDVIPSEFKSKLTVLVVDDNPRYRQQLCRLIGKIQPSSMLFEARNTSEALKLGEKVQPTLALVDVVLDEDDGILCAKRLKQLSPSTRVVVISAYPDREFRRQALSAGAVAFLDKKDFDTASVRQVVEDALR